MESRTLLSSYVFEAIEASQNFSFSTQMDMSNPFTNSSASLAPSGESSAQYAGSSTTTDVAGLDIPLLDYQDSHAATVISSTPLSKRAFLSPLRRNDWLFEELGLFMAWASFVALGVLLLFFDGQRNPSWAAGITFNTVVSWLSTTFRISLLVPLSTCISQLSWISFTQKARSLQDVVFYDSASRGPMGSLRLIFRRNIR